MSDKGLLSWILEKKTQNQKLTTQKKKKNPIVKLERLWIDLSKEDIQMANKQTHKKMLHIISYYDDADHNHSETVLHIHSDRHS